MEDKEKLWTKDFVLVIIINFLVFLNHLMILSTFPFFIERLGYSDTVSGACATAFSLVAVLARPVCGVAAGHRPPPGAVGCGADWYGTDAYGVSADLYGIGFPCFGNSAAYGAWAVAGVCEYLYLYDGHGYFASLPLFGGYGYVWYGYGVGDCLRTGYR